MNSYVPVSPTRIYDSRPGLVAPFAEQKIQTNLAADAVAAAVTITVTRTSTGGVQYVTAWDGSLPKPFAGVLTWDRKDQTVSTFAIVPLASDGTFVLSPSAETALVVDLMGYVSKGELPPPPPNQLPVATATLLGVDGLTATLSGVAADPDGTITSSVWDFGDGQTAIGLNVTHTYVADGTYTATLTVTDDKGATAKSSVSVKVAKPVPPPPPPSGDPGATIETWLNFPGDNVEDIPVGSLPSGSAPIDNFDAPINRGDQIGTRIRALLYPPTTGDYIFYISSDNSGALYISKDDTPDKTYQLSTVSGWTAYGDFGNKPTQKSQPVSLEAGKAYFIEAYSKEGWGNDHLEVAWEGPGITRAIITKQYLRRTTKGNAGWSPAGVVPPPPPPPPPPPIQPVPPVVDNTPRIQVKLDSNGKLRLHDYKGVPFTVVNWEQYTGCKRFPNMTNTVLGISNTGHILPDPLNNGVNVIRYLPHIRTSLPNGQGVLLDDAPPGVGYVVPGQQDDKDPKLFTGNGIETMRGVILDILSKHMVCEIAVAGASWPGIYLRDDIKALLQDPRYAHRIMVHVSGESYTDDNPELWARESAQYIKDFRAAGYKCPIYIMSNNGGRNIKTLLDYGKAVFDTDPLRNVVFGWQAYWDGNMTQTTEIQYPDGHREGFYQKLCGMSLNQAFDAVKNRNDIIIQVGLCGAPGALGGSVPLKDQLDGAISRGLNIAYWCWAAAGGAATLGGSERNGDPGPIEQGFGGNWNVADTSGFMDPTDGKMIADALAKYGKRTPAMLEPVV